MIAGWHSLVNIDRSTRDCLPRHCNVGVYCDSREHAAMLQQIAMQLKTFFQVMGDVALSGIFQILVKIISIGRMRAVIDNFSGTLNRTESAQISQALFRRNDLNRMFIAVNVRTEGNDGGYFSFLGDRRRHEYRQVTVPGELSTAADTVYHIDSAEMG